MNTAVELRNVSFAYSSAAQQVLQDLSFRLQYGELALLSGISGEGKTTLLSLINGVIPFALPGKLEGKVYINGEDADRLCISERARLIGSVLQNADEQIVHERAGDEVAFGCENFKMPPEKIKANVMQSLAMMKLQPGWATKTLSGGQKQRLVTAATLAMEQKILVLDEPLANLDKAGAMLLLRTLRALADDGYAVLLVEHRLDVVVPFADRLIRLEGGTLHVAENPAAELQKLLSPTKQQHPASKEDKTCMELSNIGYMVGNREILSQLDLCVHRGERIVLLGENGCGKTTLLRLLARLIQPTEGSYQQYILPGRRKKPGSKWFKIVGFVYQNPSYQLFMPTLREEVAIQAQSPQRAKEMIERFGLAGLEERHPHSLSEGQKRRAGIAAIAAGTPELILLDEPTVGQDHENLRRMIASLEELHAETGCAMVTVTHDFRCAALADRVLVLEGGRIAQEGDAGLAARYFGRDLVG